MDNPADRVKFYGALGKIKGANTYGIPREKWAKMSKKQKLAFRAKLWRERLMADPAAHAAYKQHQVEMNKRYRERKAAYRAARREMENANNLAYRRRKKAQTAIICDPEAVFAAIMKAIPRAWPKPTRDDIAGMICLDILENRATLDHVDREGSCHPI